MSVVLTGSSGYWSRFGAVASEFNRVTQGFGQELTNSVNEINAFYITEDQISVDGLYTARDSYKTVHTSWLNKLSQVVSTTTVEQVNRDVPLSNRTVPGAVAVLASQMVAESESLNRPTITTSASSTASNIGNATLTASTTNEQGVQLDMAFAEDLSFNVSADSASGGTLWRETVTITGEPAGAANDAYWPGGSGATGSFTITDAAATGFIRDGSFESWNAGNVNLPTNWSITTGTAGTNFARSSSSLRGDYAASFVSDGSTLTTIRQAVSLQPLTVYAWACWAKVSATDGSGVFTVRLVDGNGSVIVDAAGNSNTLSKNMSSEIGTSYTLISGYFRTPRQLPSTVSVQLGFTVAPASPKTVTVDLFGFTQGKQCYPGGPFVAMFSRDVASARNDNYKLTVTNSLGTDSLVRSADRLLNLRLNNLAFPTSASPTIPDDLITA